MDIINDFKLVHQGDKSLPERVADQIMDLIASRKLNTGDKLPNEFELAAQLNVGRGSIREAVKLLVSRNILVIKRGKGTFIAKHTGEIDDPFGFMFCEDNYQLALDLLDVRMQLEPWIAANAAKYATQEECDHLIEACIAVEKDIEEGINHLNSDKEFHKAIAACTHNMVMPKIIPVIMYSVDLIGNSTKRFLLKETIETHRAILDAILQHDPKAAKEAMIAHLQQNLQYLVKYKDETAK